MSYHICKNCETEHGTIEEATECCQCSNCVELETKLKAIKAICQDCRDGYAPDHPPHDMTVLLEAIEDEL